MEIEGNKELRHSRTKKIEYREREKLKMIPSLRLNNMPFFDRSTSEKGMHV